MEIARDLNLHRDTVLQYCNELVRKHYLKRDGKKGKYHITGKARGEPSLLPFSLGMDAIGKMLDWTFISSNSKYCNNKLFWTIIYGSKRSFNSDVVINIRDIIGGLKIDELVLFEMANRIGALILYILIGAMNPEITRLKLNGKEVTIDNQDQDVMNWVENAIKPVRLLEEICKLPIIYRGLEPFENTKSQLFVMNKENYDRLNQALKNVFGDVIDELNKIKSEIPGTIDYFKYKGKSKGTIHIIR